MLALPGIPRPGIGRPAALLVVAVYAALLVSCAGVRRDASVADGRLEAIASLVAEVKAFGETLGIQPTETLRRTSRERAPLSMLWLWLQRSGTIALRAPIDVRMAVGFNAHKDDVPLERVYRVEGYSVYYRQGNEFADERSAATAGFHDEGALRQVKVILHEDLHADSNFALPWEIEESLVTPLASLAAVEFFIHKGDQDNLRRSAAALHDERQLSRELKQLATEAEHLFALEAPESARAKILASMSLYPTYRRHFERQIQGQNATTALEAKLSHDLAYFRFVDEIAELAGAAPALGTLIDDLRELTRGATPASIESHIYSLRAKYRHYSG